MKLAKKAILISGLASILFMNSCESVPRKEDQVYNTKTPIVETQLVTTRTSTHTPTVMPNTPTPTQTITPTTTPTPDTSKILDKYLLLGFNTNEYYSSLTAKNETEPWGFDEIIFRHENDRYEISAFINFDESYRVGDRFLNFIIDRKGEIKSLYINKSGGEEYEISIDSALKELDEINKNPKSIFDNASNDKSLSSYLLYEFLYRVKLDPSRIRFKDDEYYRGLIDQIDPKTLNLYTQAFGIQDLDPSKNVEFYLNEVKMETDGRLFIGSLKFLIDYVNSVNSYYDAAKTVGPFLNRIHVPDLQNIINNKNPNEFESTLLEFLEENDYYASRDNICKDYEGYIKEFLSKGIFPFEDYYRGKITKFPPACLSYVGSAIADFLNQTRKTTLGDLTRSETYCHGSDCLKTQSFLDLSQKLKYSNEN